MTTIQTRPPANGVSHAPAPVPAKRPLRRWQLWTAAAILLVLVAGAFAWWRNSGAPPSLVTAPVTRATLVATVTSTGTLSARDTINIGTQVSGTISQLFVDFNSRVTKGEILAKIDPSTFEAAVAKDEAALSQSRSTATASVQSALAAGSTSVAGGANVEQARANLNSSAAGVRSADAQVVKAQAALTLAQTTVKRDQSLIASGYIAQSQLDTDQANLASAQAALSAAVVSAQQARLAATAAQAALGSLQAQSQAAGSQAQASDATAAANKAAIAAAQAQLQSDQIDLDRTVIVSPVNGTVISRAVSVGQTVAASFQTPTLFTIAKDLAQMELDLAVGEPDIGSIRDGQAIDFSVLAYPNTTFHATVAQVRQNPTTVNNVVTYDVVAYVDNRAGKLFPGMTASASIHVAKAQNALVVPIAALQWQPSAAGGTGGARTANPRPSAAASSASAWGQTGSAGSNTVIAGTAGRVFAQSNGASLTRIPVHVDLVQGASAAVTPQQPDGLRAGDLLVIGTASPGNVQVTGNPLFGQSRGGASVPRSAR